MSGPAGAVGNLVPVVDHGDPRRKWNLVVLGDGYRSDQIPDFQRHVQSFADALRATPPFDALWPAISIFRIDVTSQDAGADEPAACGGPGTQVTTYFDATFCSDWGGKPLERLLTVDAASAKSIARQQLPQTHQVLVLVNSTKYGGSGGEVAVCSMAAEAFRIAIHEIGHSAFQLADEYDDPDLPPPPDEPIQPNITIRPSRTTGKWSDLIQHSTPVPSERNPRCGSFPAIGAVAEGVVGAFEGGGYSGCGVFRPAAKCCMRNLDHPFCPVCARVISRTLAVYLDPFEPTGREATATLAFDPIADEVGDAAVVSFKCYVSEPLSEAGRYCLVLSPWFDEWLLVDHSDVVASIAGTTREDGWSIVWVWRYAWVQRENGSWTMAMDAAVADGVEEAMTMAGSTSNPPPVRHPRR